MKIYQPSLSAPKLKVLVYGPFGVGKTVFAAGAMDHPELSEVLFLNIEGGFLSILEKHPKVIDIGRDDNGHPNGRALADLEDVVWKVVNKAKGFENFKTIVLDSGSELQVRDLQDIVQAGVDRGGRKGDLDDTHQSDYGKDTARMRRVLRMLRDVPLNVIITALATEVLSPGDNPQVIGIMPQLTKKLSSSLCGYMDHVWFMYTSDGKRFLQTQESGKGIVKAKTRGIAFSKILGGRVEDPNIATLYKQLCESFQSEVKSES